jgi:hypothetical protein
MALDIWLPLNNNINNYGTRKVTLTTSSATYSTAGKVCEKGLSAGSISLSSSDAGAIFNNNEISIAFWIYVNAATGTSAGDNIFGNNNYSSTTNNRKFSIFQYPTVNDIHLSWQNNTANSTYIGTSYSNKMPSY